MRTDQYLHYSSPYHASCKESVVSSLFNRVYSITANKDDLHKENAGIKQVLKENGYQESIFSKIFKRITDNHRLPQSHQLTHATDILEEEIKISINLLYVEGACEKLRRILRSHKTKSTFYAENTLSLFLCKPKDPVATEDKKKSFMKLTVVTVKQSTSVNLNGLSNCVQMNTKDLSGIAIMIKMNLLNTVGKQITTLAGIRRKLLLGKTG